MKAAVMMMSKDEINECCCFYMLGILDIGHIGQAIMDFMSFLLDWIQTDSCWMKTSLVSCFMLIVYEDIWLDAGHLVSKVACLLQLVLSAAVSA